MSSALLRKGLEHPWIGYLWGPGTNLRIPRDEEESGFVL